MDYATLREARLSHPFRPFFVRTKAGRVYFISDAFHLLVSPKVVLLYDANQRCQEMTTAAEIDGIMYAPLA